MNLNDLANIGQIVGALAVVISLFYVAHQIRQNTNAVRSAAAQMRIDNFFDETEVAQCLHLLLTGKESK